MRLIGSWILLVVLVAIAGGIFAWSGAYDIGADVPHWPLVERAIGTLVDRSVEHHANGIAVPANLDDPKVLAEGAEHYDAMCKGCHLAPGMDDSEIRPGLYPRPPKLVEHGADDPPNETFWIIKHGIKMSAMPAWGTTHSDDKIWAMVAFVHKLPGMTPAQYQQMTGSSGGDHDRDADHDEPAHDAGEPAPGADAPPPAPQH